MDLGYFTIADFRQLYYKESYQSSGYRDPTIQTNKQKDRHPVTLIDFIYNNSPNKKAWIKFYIS